MATRTIDTIKGRYRIEDRDGKAYAVSTGDNDDVFEFDKLSADLTDKEISDRIAETFDKGEVGVWRTDFENIPRGIGLLLYSGEIYEPAVGCIAQDDDEVISDSPQYDHCPLNHIDQFMIIPDFEP